MKCCSFFVLVAILPQVAPAATIRADTSPVVRVVGLLRSLKAEVETDGKSEQQIYDKFACWTEKTVADKTADIAEAEATIKSSTESIMDLSAKIATGETSIKNLAADIADNEAAQKEADEKRKAEHDAFMAEHKENVACQGALKEAIKVLNGTGLKASLMEKRRFLGAVQSGQAVNVVARLRRVLKNSRTVGSVSSDDLKLLSEFVNRAFKASMSAMQVSRRNKLNPFGDYAPHSDRIQGILKGMYDAFTADIGKDAAEEAEALKAYTELKATRTRELATLQKTKLDTEKDVATFKTDMATTKQLKKDAQEDLAADTAFLAETKTNSQLQAAEWAERCRLRTEELMGINEAIQILGAPDSAKIFSSAYTSFVQISSLSIPAGQAESRRNHAYMQLRKLASGSHSFQFAKIAANLKLGGHFDVVIAEIDKMMELLRKEEAADIFHKDRCESGENANKNEIQDLEHDLEMNNATRESLSKKIKELDDKIDQLVMEIDDTNKTMADALAIRNQETAAFKKALKNDVDSIALIEKAIVAFTKYYTRNDLKLTGLLQENPEYSINPDTAPTPVYSSADKFSSQTGGIVAILQMIKEDFEKEVKTSREEFATSEAEYDASTADMMAKMDALNDAKATTEKAKAETEAKLAAAEGHKVMKDEDMATEEKLKTTLYEDCSWVATNFQSRYDKRKTEMKGLTDAKAHLSGIMRGEVA